MRQLSPHPHHFQPSFQPGPDLAPMPEPRTLVLIPARMAAPRLPGKPLSYIAGLPMIVHVLRRAEAAKIGRVAVATDTPEIAAAVSAHGGEAVMTHANHHTGSDRIYEALCKLDPRGEDEIVVNLQGDFPTISPDNLQSGLGSPGTAGLLRALYFTGATAPYGDGPRYHHIGVYAYRRAALERFVNFTLPP